jgi:hypothetical protein
MLIYSFYALRLFLWQVVHLVRDPRAVINSRNELKSVDSRMINLATDPDPICYKMLSDHNALETLPANQ